MNEQRRKMRSLPFEEIQGIEIAEVNQIRLISSPQNQVRRERKRLKMSNASI